MAVLAFGNDMHDLHIDNERPISLEDLHCIECLESGVAAK